MDGRVVDLLIGGGRIIAIGEGLAADTDPAVELIPADGRLVTPSFVNGHLHLDKVHTLPMLGDAALQAYTVDTMSGAMSGIEIASAVKADYDRAWITPNVDRALTEAVRYGTLHIQAFVDVDTAAGLEGLHGVLAARRRFRDVLDVRVVAFPQDGLLRDPGAAALCEEAMRLGADVVGGIPWIEFTDRDARAHVQWACALAARLDRPVAMLVDDAGDPSLRTTEMLAEALVEHGLVGRGTACHARAVGLYPVPAQLRLAGLARRAGLGFVSDPHTGPLSLPVGRFLAEGVAVALGQDDIEDAYYPYGRNNMLEVAFLASHLWEWKSTEDQLRLVDLVTTGAARVLGLAGHTVAEGSAANLCVHEAERIVDVLREHAAPRWVISRGAVVASSSAGTSWGSWAEPGG